MSGALPAAAGPSSDRASVFAMGTLMGVAVAGAGALALSYYARMERERFAADARERYARASHRRHSSEGAKDASRDRAGRYRRSAGMIASAHVANMARQTSVDALDSDVDAHDAANVHNAHMDEYQIMAEEANDLMRASIGSLDGEHAAAFADVGDVTSSSKTDGGGGGGGGGGGSGGGGSGGGVVATRRVVTLNLPDTDMETDGGGGGGGIGKHRKKTHRRHSEDPNSKGSHAHDGNLSRSTPSQRNTRGAQGAHWVPRSPSTAAVKDGVIGTLEPGAESEYTEFTEDESGNDGDHLMTTLTVVDTPRGAQGGTRATEFDFDDGGVRGLSASRLSRQDLAATVSEMDEAEGLSLSNRRAIAGREGEKEESEEPPRPRRSFTRALSFGDVGDVDDDDAVGDAVGGGSNAESPAPGIDPPTSPSDEAEAAAAAARADPDTAFGKSSGSTGAASPRGETPSWGIPSKKTSFGGTAGVAAGTPGTPDADSRVVDASAVPSDARGAFGVGGGGRRPAPPVASRDFRANDEEVGVNVSKPLTPRASLDVRAAPRSIDGGSRGLTGDSNHPNHPNHSNQPNHVHARTGAGAGTTDTSAEYTYGRVLAPEEELSSECEEVCLMLRHCTRLRERYLFVSELEKRPERARVDPDHSPHYPHISGVGFAPNPSAPSSPRAPPRELSFNDSVNARDERDGDGEEKREDDVVDPSRAPRGSAVVTGKVDIVPDDELPGPSNHVFEMIAGVMHVYEEKTDDGVRGTRRGVAGGGVGRSKADGSTRGGGGGVSSGADDEGSEGDGTRTLLFAPPATATEFFHDMHAILRVHSYGPSKSFCHKRLNLTEQKFSLHVMLNADREFMAQKEAPHRDFYNVRKVDTHVHHSACMNQKHLLRFIKSKLKREPHEQVIYRDGKFLNLREVFESINLSSYDLNVDTLDMHADKNTFHRFDRFNLKYNPCGQSRLREVFIKQDNLIRGRFLAEVTKEVISDLEAAKYQMAEYRISIYGRRAAEWDTLASWVLNNRIFSNNVVWLIQLPRLYNIYRGQGTVQNFQQMLDNIFQPLFEVTVDPSSHPALHHFLQLVVGFDMVDDESKPERRPSKHMRTPEEWDVPHNPAFAYYAYYVYANLYTLNKLRESKGLNTISFRPHAGEAGDIDHLAAAFLLTKNIAHGINLRKSPVLQYLYYLEQIGLNMSPLSNNSLFLDYHRNPFPVYFARGLRVTLSTDDPLQIHMTKEPLVEEYSVAASVWKLSAADLCEIARNSVLNSDFPHEDKQHWVSDSYWLPGPSGNDMKKTNVPNIRVQFRNDVLAAERALVAAGVAQATAKGRALHVS